MTGAAVVDEPSGAAPSQDADGALDHGNVEWTVTDDGWSHLEGEWGSADVLSAEPVVRLLEDR